MDEDIEFDRIFEKLQANYGKVLTAEEWVDILFEGIVTHVSGDMFDEIESFPDSLKVKVVSGYSYTIPEQTRYFERNKWKKFILE